jgi:hypothetical protein
MHDTQRLERLRSEVREEKRLAVALCEKFNQEPLKDRAVHVADESDSIMSMFLGVNLEAWQPAETESSALDRVEQMIEIMLRRPRKTLEGVLHMYGADATLIGN